MKYGFKINIGAVETEDMLFTGAEVEVNTEMTIGEFTAVIKETKDMLKEAPALIGEMAKTFRKYQAEFDKEDEAKHTSEVKEKKAPKKIDIPEHIKVIAKALGVNPEHIMEVRL